MNDSLRRYKVLLFDDSELTLEIQAGALEEAGFEVRTAQTLDDFGAILNSWLPEVILTDVNMPGLSGTEVCAALKQRYDTAHVPIVLCSGMSREELQQLARQCEADAFVSKADGVDRLGEELRLLCEELAW
ncbi:MAG: response regulator [Myxococcales bacterium]|nr:response regulator [Myxococcales bacterium]